MIDLIWDNDHALRLEAELMILVEEEEEEKSKFDRLEDEEMDVIEVEEVVLWGESKIGQEGNVNRCCVFYSHDQLDGIFWASGAPAPLLQYHLQHP